ncbi:MAG: DUF2177 family protein [Betaproteobacteria bacterium]
MKNPFDLSALMFGSAYVVAFLVLAILDGVWLGFVAREFYRRELGTLMLDSIPIAPAAAFYVLYPLGLVVLALQPAPATATGAFARSAVVGLMAYGTYDLTNLATLRGWSLRLSLVDIGWGAVVSGLAGLATWWFILRAR